MKLVLSVAALGMGASVATAVATQTACATSKAATQECAALCATHDIAPTQGVDSVELRQAQLEALASSAPCAPAAACAPSAPCPPAAACAPTAPVAPHLGAVPAAPAVPAVPGRAPNSSTTWLVAPLPHSQSLPSAPQSGALHRTFRYHDGQLTPVPEAPGQPLQSGGVMVQVAPRAPAAESTDEEPTKKSRKRAFGIATTRDAAPQRSVDGLDTVQRRMLQMQRRVDEERAEVRKRAAETQVRLEREQSRAMAQARAATERARAATEQSRAATEQALRSAERAQQEAARAQQQARVKVRSAQPSTVREAELEQRVRELERRLEQLEGAGRASGASGGRAGASMPGPRSTSRAGDDRDCTPERASIVVGPRIQKRLSFPGGAVQAPAEANGAIRVWSFPSDGETKSIVIDGSRFDSEWVGGLLESFRVDTSECSSELAEALAEAREDFEEELEDLRDEFEDLEDFDADEVWGDFEDVEEFEALDDFDAQVSEEGDAAVVRSEALTPLETAKVVGTGPSGGANAQLALDPGLGQFARLVSTPAASSAAPSPASLELHNVVSEMRAEVEALRASLRDLREQVRSRGR